MFVLFWAPTLVLLFASGSGAQYPALDALAGKVVQKYQQATCEQLWKRKGSRNRRRNWKSSSSCAAIRRARQHFLDKVAGPIANKMFECGMIP